MEEITINKILGAKLKKERINRDITQKTLGINIGVSHQQIRKYEKGLNRIPIIRLLKITRDWNLDIREFLKDILP